MLERVTPHNKGEWEKGVQGKFNVSGDIFTPPN
jgi:hypothetical protein